VAQKFCWIVLTLSITEIALDRKDDPNARKSATASTVLNTGENGFDIKMS